MNMVFGIGWLVLALIIGFLGGCIYTYYLMASFIEWRDRKNDK